jgi:ketosteroid isomerase-like protein
MAGSGSIDQVAVQLASAFNARDAVKLASLYTETATLMPPNEGAKKDGSRYRRGSKQRWDDWVRSRSFP